MTNEFERVVDQSASSTDDVDVVAQSVGNLAVDLAAQSAAALAVSDAALENAAGLTQGHDTVATAGTAEALNGGAALAVPDGHAVKIKALPGNTGNVYVGDSTVSASSGYVLTPGDTVSIQVADVATIYADVDTGGEGVSWTVEQ